MSCKTQDNVIKHVTLTQPEFRSQWSLTAKLHHVVLITTDTPPIVPPLLLQHRSRWVGKYRTKKKSLSVCNENANSLPQSPVWHAPHAAMKLEPNLSLCSIMCILTDLLDVMLNGWGALQRQNDRGHIKIPEVFLQSAGCIEATTTWLTRINGKSQDSQREQWIRFKQHNIALSVVQCQLKQMGRWNSCASKLIGCAASSWQPVSADFVLVTDYNCNQITNTFKKR